MRAVTTYLNTLAHHFGNAAYRGKLFSEIKFLKGNSDNSPEMQAS
jgi:hypothetical protein